VTGVDLYPQPRYPFEFVQGDALAYLERNWRHYDAIHASPPCQAFTNAQKLMGNEHPDFITPTREILEQIGLPYVIENVPGAPLEDPVELCGAMFGLGTYRHRLFETNFHVEPPEHPKHAARTTKMGRTPVDGEMMHVVGNFSGVEKAKKAMGIDWMNRDGLRESIPPAYAEYIGHALMATVMSNKVKEAAA
jgi:DNA (cytosine-5)-methyltransferase 1